MIPDFSSRPTALLYRIFAIVACCLVLELHPSAIAQKGPPQTSKPVNQQPEDPDSVRVFTEEVRLPLIATDQYGHYDPTLESDDVLVLEDGIAQQIKSVRHLPANVMLVLDTGGEQSGLGGQSKRTSLTRRTAIELLNQLPEGGWVAVMQFNNAVELIQPWTRDKQAVLKTLNKKLSSGKRARFLDALAAAARQLEDRPEGSRHVVLITDGVDTSGKEDRSDAIKRLIAARATVHIISYTEFVRQKKEGQPSSVSAGARPASSDPIASTDPTLPPGTTRSPTYGVSIRFDPAMRRQRKAYEAEVRKSQQVLSGLAEETGGRIFLPKSGDEMLAQAREVSHEVAAEYVVTYRPKRALAGARQGEYRKIEVASRRVGLSLRSRRGYVVPTPR